jgi:hypothetical protein
MYSLFCYLAGATREAPNRATLSAPPFDTNHHQVDPRIVTGRNGSENRAPKGWSTSLTNSFLLWKVLDTSEWPTIVHWRSSASRSVI